MQALELTTNKYKVKPFILTLKLHTRKHLNTLNTVNQPVTRTQLISHDSKTAHKTPQVLG